MTAKRDLLLLTSAALSLPALAAAPPVNTEVSISTSRYQEGAADAQDVIVGSDERYDIDIYQFHLLAPVAGNYAVQLLGQREVMSGASPWGTVADANQDTALIMSGATINDSRNSASLSLTRYNDQGSLNVTLSGSDEDDYEAKGIALSGEYELENQQQSLSLSLSYSSDELNPTDAAIFGRISNASKNTRSLSLGWTQVINAVSTVQLGLTGTEHRGFLSDPYKLRDVRPDQRSDLAWSVKYRRYITSTDAALHLDYRFFTNNHGIRSHTLESAWLQNLGDFQVKPSIRYYSQNEADYYQAPDDFSLPPDQPQSSDHRVAAFGAIDAGLSITWQAGGWRLNGRLSRYISDEKYGLSDGASHPAALGFKLFTLGITRLF